MEKYILKVYGPYISKQDGRKRVLLYFNDKSKTTKSLARFNYEQKHGKLPAHLTVDHIDEDFTNDDIDNLQPLTREENIKKLGKMALILLKNGSKVFVLNVELNLLSL